MIVVKSLLVYLVFVNIICDALITNPKKIQEAYNKLPEKARKSIDERDK